MGDAYLPEWNFNGLGNMGPGEGYQVKTSAECTLEFSANSTSNRLSAMEVTNNRASKFETATNTGSNMTIGIFDDAWSISPRNGDEIAAYNKNGELIGSALYTSPVTVLTVWGDDQTTSKVDGMLNGESMTFKLWNKRNNSTSEFVVKEWILGQNSYETDAVHQAGSIEFVDYNSNVAQIDLYPIPAKQELNIEVNLANAEKITISIFNLIGELMATNSYTLSEGLSPIKLNIEVLQSGTYLCKMNGESSQITRKFNVIK